ncbi:MAG: transcriptional regulator [Burkholderiales bacterium RIFCSPLOWO2_12_FULL_61_40]|nr:MAG: transcriptional regulator [Burkholderiales bacterium RIFCSPLOWO2_12_FULL_61_40]
MMDKLRLPADLGKAIAQYREENKLAAVAISAKAGRSRTVLHKLERGDDVTVASLFDFLRAMGLCLSLQKAGMPTLEEMQRRFADEDDDDAA